MTESSLLTPKDLANRWSVSLHTLSQWRWNGKGPLFVKLGSRVMYRIQDVEYFEEQKLRRDTTQTEDGMIQICLQQVHKS